MKQVKIILRTGQELHGPADNFDFSQALYHTGSDQLRNFSKGKSPVLLRMSEVSAIFELAEVQDA